MIGMKHSSSFSRLFICLCLNTPLVLDCIKANTQILQNPDIHHKHTHPHSYTRDMQIFIKWHKIPASCPCYQFPSGLNCWRTNGECTDDVFPKGVCAWIHEHLHSQLRQASKANESTRNNDRSFVHLSRFLSAYFHLPFYCHLSCSRQFAFNAADNQRLSITTSLIEIEVFTYSSKHFENGSQLGRPITFFIHDSSLWIKRTINYKLEERWIGYNATFATCCLLWKT